jgi:hypothetical protein
MRRKGGRRRRRRRRRVCWQRLSRQMVVFISTAWQLRISTVGCHGMPPR